MTLENLFFALFLAGAVFDFASGQFLEAIDFVFRKKHGKKIPARLKEFINPQETEKICAYENEKYFLWVPLNILEFLLKLALVFSGFYALLFTGLLNRFQNIFAAAIGFAFISQLPNFILGLPFSLFSEFRIEKKFGFSNMTLKTWLGDLAKSAVLSAVLGVPILCAAVALICSFNKIWWLLFALIYLAFSLAVSYVYPIWIAPLFNKFTPLEQGEIKERLENLLARTGFKSNGIFKMDASRRSNHSNAYFTGFGKNKRIVLFDTILSQLEPSEIETVLAHELGHFKKHHITKRLCAMVPLIFISLFISSMAIRLPGLYSTFGFGQAELPVLPQVQLLGLFFFGMTVEGYGRIFALISNFFSRRDEFQADSYSRKLCGSGQPLVSALIKLNKKNLSELEPPKIYSLFNYSHPPLMERINSLERQENAE
ncbi:M48 family metallopeptidase [Treponema sp.]|uniref:M48 family metallopeptidase n=1 Tax=Treponema sp. TaxID=166 RepID=UPI003F0490A6